MTSVTELSLVHSVCDALSALPLTFPDDYHPPPSLIPGKVRVFPIELLPPPEKKQGTVVAASDPSLSLNFKSLKPPYTLSLNVSPADSISDLKSRVSKSNSTAGPAPSLRLLLKGKALQDNKLVKDYDISDGSTITIMSKPGIPMTVEPTTEVYGLSPSAQAERGSPGTYPRHQRKLSDIPAVVLSPAGSPGQTTPLLPAQSLPLPPNPSYSPTHAQIPLDLNAFPIPSSTPEQTPQNAVFASPEFWEGLYAFLQTQFDGKIDDAIAAFEEFLLSAKNRLTPHEIARIRDRVGVIGMGGN